MPKIAVDKYANVGYVRTATTVNDTLAFDQLRFAVGIFQGVGIVIHRILYFPDESTLRKIVAASDTLWVGLAASDALAGITDISQPAVLDQKVITGIGVNVEPFISPLITDWTGLPGGGKIFTPNPLFSYIDTAGYAALAVCWIQVEFTFVELSDKDYIELIQSKLPANL